MIIVEGPDGAGKSTLVGELCHRLGLLPGERRTGDRDRLYETTVDDSYDAVHQAVLGLEPPRIWDRMFYSDPIYAEVVRNEESRFTPSQFEHLHRMVLAMKVPIILCLPPFKHVKQNVEATQQMGGVRDNIRQIYEQYQDLASRFSTGQVRVYDYTIRGTLPRLTVWLKEYLAYREERLQ